MISAAVLTMDQNTLTERVSNVLRLVFTDQRSGVKRLARVAGSSTRSAENWLRGENMPDGFYLLRLIATVPELASEVRRLTAMSAELDPTFERDLHRLIQTYHRVSEERHASDVLATDGRLRKSEAGASSPSGRVAHPDGGEMDALSRPMADAAD